MKYTKYLLLLLLVTSCASRRAVRHHGYQTYTPPPAPVQVQVPAPVVVEEEPEAEEPVVSARPLISQVHRAQQGTWQYEKQQALDQLCQSPIFETSQLGLYVYDLTDGQPLYAINAAQRMRPASCQKIVTAVTALNFLKEDYRLTTDFRIAGTVSGGPVTVDAKIKSGKWRTAQRILTSGTSMGEMMFVKGEGIGLLELRNNGTELWATPKTSGLAVFIR